MTLIIWTCFVRCSCFHKILFGSSIWPPGFTSTCGAQVLLPFEQNRQTKILRYSELHITFSNLHWADNVICKGGKYMKLESTKWRHFHKWIQTSEPHCVYTDSIPEIWFDFPTENKFVYCYHKGTLLCRMICSLFHQPHPL